MAAYSTLLYEKNGNIVSITLNRPQKLNAINDVVFTDLKAALAEAETDDDVKVIILKGKGRAFCVGRDMSGKETSETASPDWRNKQYYQQYLDQEYQLQDFWKYFYNFPKNTIAQVHGYCLDAGCWLALGCQAIIATEDAKFGEPAIRIGQITPSPLWTHLVGIKKANEILFTGKMVDGKEAERIGLINRAVPTDELEETVQKLAEGMNAIAMDGQLFILEGFQVAADVKGLGADWKHWGKLHVSSCLRPPGVNELDFFDIRDKKGLKNAIEEANAPFKNLV